MFCTYHYSETVKKWAVLFYSDNGTVEGFLSRNNRKAEFFDRELDATNRIAELMAIEGIKYFPPTLENRIISAIHDMIREFETQETYSVCGEYQREGRILALEELAERIQLMKK